MDLISVPTDELNKRLRERLSSCLPDPTGCALTGCTNVGTQLLEEELKKSALVWGLGGALLGTAVGYAICKAMKK